MELFPEKTAFATRFGGLRVVTFGHIIYTFLTLSVCQSL